ncbi:MAG: hypothetical protein KF770_17210 [Anaerolineae bacterium]|nr:hypothetical protein [Anaerolineae bacterium]
MKETMLVLILVLMLSLAACGGQGAAMENGGDTAVSQTVAQVESGTAVTTLTANYDDALSVVGQLAIGIVQLEETDLAVDETQAAALLPLWQAYQALGQSDTTAVAELQAVVNQIERTMTPAQITAIAELKLTNEGVTTMMQNGELGFSPGGPGGFAPTDESGITASGGGGGFAGGFPGGGPGGGVPGGGVPGGEPGGGVPGGGFPGGPGGAELSEDDLATRRAGFEQNGGGGFQERMFSGVVVRLLEDKLGIVSEIEVRQNVMAAALTAVAEAANLTVDELQAQLAEGQTMAAVVEANGGDLAALQTKLVEIFGDLPDAAELDLAQSVNEWLGVEE